MTRESKREQEGKKVGTFNRDHAGGNEKIKKLIPGIKVYGSLEDNVEGQTDVLGDGDEVSLGDSITIKAIHTPWFAYFSVAVSLNSM